MIRRGDAVAHIGQVAAVLRGYSVAGVDYIETSPAEAVAPHACGIVLMPWPNRVAGGQWTWQGSVQQLDITEPETGNASHGLLRYTAYRLTARTEDSVTLAAAIYPQHGWPFTLDTEVTYALTDDGLSVTHRVRNVGEGEAVFGCGAHPYVRIGGVPVDDLCVTIRAGSYLVTNEAMIPVEKRPLDGALVGLSRGMSLRGLHLDTGFADLAAVGGRIEHSVAAPDGRALTIWADPVFAYTIVFTPDDFPNDTSRGPAGLHRALAIEPMTCPTNALNTGEGLIHLAPGETWEASWGLAPSPVTPTLRQT